MASLIYCVQQLGYVPIVERVNNHAKTIDFGLLSLKSGDVFDDSTHGNELGLLVLGGRCTVEGENYSFADIGRRENVFAGKPYAVYLPPGTSYRITTDSWVEIGLSMTPCSFEGVPKLITQSEVRHKSFGQLHWRRDVHYVIEPGADSHSLRIGEVMCPPGHWSFPPHRHNTVEEVYFYRVRPADGFGFQMVYDRDESRGEYYIVKNNDTVVITQGYHPVGASPADSLYVLWIMTPKSEEIPLIAEPDPRYAWVENCNTIIGENSMK